MNRYTAEYLGGDNGDNDWEWCVVDEELGWCGCAIMFDLTEHEAKMQTAILNGENPND